MTNPTPEPLAWLTKLTDDLRHCRRISFADLGRLTDALQLYLTGADATMDDALGLGRRRGERDARHVLALAERNTLIKQIAEDHYHGQPKLRQAEGLHRELSRYRAAAWTYEQRQREPPAHEHADLWRILKLRVHVPTVAHLRKLLRD